MYIDKIYQNVDMDVANNVIYVKEIQNEYPQLFFVTAETPTGRRLRVYGNIEESEFNELNEKLKKI